MILTVTMNPSIDTAYPLAGTLKVDDVNRVELIKTAGGKGLNVTRVLGHLDDDVVATNLLGDRMGDFIADRMDEDGVSHDFVRIFGENRVCIAALHEGNQTEFFEADPAVSADELDRFTAKFCELAARRRRDDVRRPAARRRRRLLRQARGHRQRVGHRGPSRHLGRFARRRREALPRQAQAERAGRIDCVNATGSGDSTIAGFTHGIAAGAELAEVLRLGNTCDALNTMDPETGHLPWASGTRSTTACGSPSCSFYIVINRF